MSVESIQAQLSAARERELLLAEKRRAAFARCNVEYHDAYQRWEAARNRVAALRKTLAEEQFEVCA